MILIKSTVTGRPELETMTLRWPALSVRNPKSNAEGSDGRSKLGFVPSPRIRSLYRSVVEYKSTHFLNNLTMWLYYSISLAFKFLEPFNFYLIKRLSENEIIGVYKSFYSVMLLREYFNSTVSNIKLWYSITLTTTDTDSLLKLSF